MKSKKQIIAIGGGGFTHNEDSDLDQFFLDQISKIHKIIIITPESQGDYGFLRDKLIMESIGVLNLHKEEITSIMISSKS